jgi:S-DNA-T family DNA segregation ATPase FtsK/SpoIIIE
MRLPRTNFADIPSQDTEVQEERDADAGSDVNPQPAWQNYFYVAPNVRFTRTPEVHIRKHPVSEAAPARQDPATPQKNVPEATVRATVAPRPVEQAPKVAPGRWSNLSDHAFFELAGPRLDVPARPVPPRMTAGTVPASPKLAAIAAAAPVQRLETSRLPQTIQATDVASLYRVIECAITQPPFRTAANVNASVAAEAPEAAIPPQAASHEPGPGVQDSRPGRRAITTQAVVAATPHVPAKVSGAALAPTPSADGYELPSVEFLQSVPEGQGFYMSQERLEQNADLLESVLEDFGVRGEIIHVRPGPVVTLYEFEPAPGVKSSRVINLADDIARSMSAISARVAVVPGRNVIGIELPNETRETVYFRELVESDGFQNSSYKLALCLGKTIGGEPVIAELAKMPHLLVAGTTGSGKSVAINTMILSLLYRLRPEECRLIMVDPKMLELSVYDGIPHLLTPVVTDSKKAVTALKWAVREMEDRYRKMARLGVRNIDGYNQRAALARESGESVSMQVQTGFEKGTGQPLFEEQVIDLSPMPFIVIIVDEMADLMMVAGKEIEGAIQRLAQMARAAGIHLIMATQRPSVDVITGTIKANFPTRISFQVTSKIDSRTILGEQGAEQLLGQGDMLHTAGGGRISRVHGPFVSDEEVERAVAHLKAQGMPDYLDTVTTDEDDEIPEEEDAPVFDKSALAAEDGSDAMFDDAVKIVMRDKKCSTSYIQRRLGIGYNRAASLVEKMEQEGLVGAPNHVGKREILAS